MDSVDFKLLRMLSSDAGKSLREMSKEVGLSISGVRRRIERLKRSGLIKGYSAIIDPKKFGLGLVAFVSVDVDPRDAGEVVRSLSRRREVVELYRVTGGHNLMMKVRAKDLNDLNRFVGSRVSSFDSVKGVQTIVAMETLKETPLHI